MNTPIFRILVLASFFCQGCQSNPPVDIVSREQIRLAKEVVVMGLKNAFGSPLPFACNLDGIMPLFDPPQHMLEVRAQCHVSENDFGKYFRVKEWRKTSIPRSIAAQAPGFDFPTSERIATSYEQSAAGWDFRIVRAWGSGDIVLIAIRSADHWRYKVNGLDY